MGIRNQSQARDAHIWTLRMAMSDSRLLCLARGSGDFLSPESFYRADTAGLNKGALIKPSEYLAPNAYVFAHCLAHPQ